MAPLADPAVAGMVMNAAPRIGVPLALLAVLGPVAVAAAWAVVRAGRASVWAAMGLVTGGLGILSLATGRVGMARMVRPDLAALIGLGAGVALYLATAGFLAVARGWRALGRQAAALYGQGRDLPMVGAMALAGGVAVGEELMWRGVVLVVAALAMGPFTGALVAWAGYVAANAVSGSIPIVLAAVVGGAVWTGLAAWTGGPWASLACHVVWTALMVARPPVPSPARR